MSEKLLKVFQSIDQSLRDAKLQDAQKALHKLKRLSFSGEDSIRFASLCCRASVPGLGVSKLRAIVGSAGRKNTNASPEHYLVYASCLMLLGACRDAEAILRRVPETHVFEARKIQAYIHIKEWNYHLAIPHLRAHIQSLPSGDYASTVSKLNLAMSLNFEGTYHEAAEILNEITSVEENFKFSYLKGNSYRLLGLLEFNRENYEVAMQCFQKAYAVFGANGALDGGVDSFLIRKWIALNQYFMQKGDAVSKIMLDSLQQEALVRRHWETVRDIDYQLATFHQDEKLLIRLYYGTSYPHFKERLCKRFPTLQIPQSYTWNLGTGDPSKMRLFEIEDSNIKLGQAIYKLMEVLTSDFYRVFNTLDFFQSLYPGEVYSYGHSEQKVHQTATRLRRQFAKDKLPFVIESTNGLFRLSPDSPFQIVIHEKPGAIDSPNAHRLKKIRSRYGQERFNLTDVMACLSIGRTTANNFVRDQVSEGNLVRFGQSKSTEFRIVENQATESKKAA